MKIFCCICIYDNLLSLNTDEIIDSIANCSLLSAGFMIIEFENEIYICCRETMYFCCDYYNFDEDYCPDVVEPCIDSLYFGNIDICDFCISQIIEYLSQSLTKIK